MRFQKALVTLYSALLSGLLLAVVFGGLFMMFVELLEGGLVIPLIVAVLTVPILALSSWKSYRPIITLKEERVWSWPGLRSVLRQALDQVSESGTLPYAALLSAVTFGLVGALLGRLAGGSGLFGGLVLSLIGVLSSAPSSVLIKALSSLRVYREFQQRSKPNQGIWQTSKNQVLDGTLNQALLMMLVGLPAGAVFGALVREPSMPLIWALIGGLTGVLIGAPFGALNAAIYSALLEHSVLRFTLSHYGYLPFNLVPFLDAMSERILLRKVGGGYTFIHRMLLDYFASLYPDEEE